MLLFFLFCWIGCVALEGASSLTPRGVAWLHEVLCYLNIGSWGDKSLRDSRKIFWFELNWAFSTARYVGRIEESFRASRTQAVDPWLWCWWKWFLLQGWDLLPPSEDLSPLTPFFATPDDSNQTVNPMMFDQGEGTILTSLLFANLS